MLVDKIESFLATFTKVFGNTILRWDNSSRGQFFAWTIFPSHNCPAMNCHAKNFRRKELSGEQLFGKELSGEELSTRRIFSELSAQCQTISDVHPQKSHQRVRSIELSLRKRKLCPVLPRAVKIE